MPSDNTRAFLQAILPSEGLFCAVVIQDKRSRQYFYDTVDKLAEAVVRLDGQLTDPHGAVYHGCASYKTQGRKAADVLVARSFWLDVDAGAGKPYAGGREAASAVASFCSGVGLPFPLFVSSGRGVHCYWPLERALEPAEWLVYASGLKRLCVDRGLHTGPERTSDIASILRPVGCYHRKGDPLPVRAGPIPAPFQLEQFAVLRADGRRIALPARRISGPADGLAARLGQLDAPQQVDFDLLAARCGQMGQFKAKQGQLPEPLWYAGLGLLAKCQSGEAVAHAWSQGDPRYNHGETQAKLNRARALTGPPTCAHFRSLEPATCAACPFSVNTPLDVLLAPAPNEHLAEAPAPEEKPYEDFSIYSYQQDGSLCIKTETNDGKPLLRKLTSFPIYFCSVHTGELRTFSFTYLLRHWLPQEGWKDLEVSAKTIFGAQGISALADLGIVVHDAEGFRKFVRDSIDRLNATEKLKVQYEQFGWKHDNQQFLYGLRLFGPGGVVPVAGSAELRLRSQWLVPKPSGTLEGWKAAADSLFGAGSESQSFTILASFAAPLMRFLQDEEGGSIVSLVTRDSGTGKTTSLAGAYTVWSQAARGLSLTTIDTKVSKGLTLATMGNLPVMYDEISTKDPDEVHDMIMLFTNGRDKMRGTQDGQIQHTAASWQTILFTASNASLVNAIQASGRSEAPGFRVLEFPILSAGPLTPIEADALKRRLEMNAGHAGDAFLRYLVKPETLAWVKRKLPEVTNEIYVSGGFRKEHRFWVRTLGAVATTALIVKHLGLVSFNPDRVMKWAIGHFVAQKDAAQVVTTSIMPGMLAQFLNEHLGETLVMPREHTQRGLPQQPVFEPQRSICARRDIDTGRYLIDKSVLRSWLAKREITYRDFIQELVQLGVITNPNRNATLAAGTARQGGQVYCVSVDGLHTMLTGAITPAAEPTVLRAMR